MPLDPLASRPIGQPSTGMPPTERRLVALLAMVQFVNVLDFMMVMPLGPDFARDLGIPTAELGLVGGSYTASASVSGLVAAVVLDRFRRKPALLSVMLGLALATFAGALATGLGSLLTARVLAGAFGGPATALSLAIVADAVPIERRGRALGVVMGAFSIASIAGVPAGLELARRGGWRAPFLGVGALTLLVVAAAARVMTEPENARDREPASLARFMRQLQGAENLLSLATGATIMFASFLIVPNMASYVQRNLGFPRERIGLMYLGGGVASLVAMQVAGRVIDRTGARLVAVAGTAVAVFALWQTFLPTLSPLHPVAFSTLFMSGTSVRAIAFNTMTSRVPRPNERGAFMSLQSTVQHFASALGAFTSSKLLSSEPSGRLIGAERLAVATLGLSVLMPVLLFMLERRLDARAAAERARAEAA